MKKYTSLKQLLALASPFRSADANANLTASTQTERVKAQMCLADVELKKFLNEDFVDPKIDEVSRLIQKQFSPDAFQKIAHHTVGSFREWLLDYQTTSSLIQSIKWGLTPEMVSAVSKIMRNQDLISVAKKCSVVTHFRNTLGLANHLSVRLQPNHPTDDTRGILASIVDGLLMGAGDAVIGINPATDSPEKVEELLYLLDRVINVLEIPTQSCVLSHVSTLIPLMKKKIPVDLVFQSIAGTEISNRSFGVSLEVLAEAHSLALELKRGSLGQNVMYFETGQGSALSSKGHWEMDAQTCEVRAYAVAREFSPLLVNSVVGFIGPEYLYDGKQIIRAGLEDHFCGKLMGLPMGVDICYTTHSLADQNDMDNLLSLLGLAGVSYIMGIPGADDVMLNYQSTSFHDALYLREVLKLRPAPEFQAWLEKMKIMNKDLQLLGGQAPCFGKNFENILKLASI